jgi:antirestriction protein ArdC
VPIDRFEISRRRWHLHEIARRVVVGARTADSKIRTGCRNQRLGSGLNLAWWRRDNRSSDLLRQTTALVCIEDGKALEKCDGLPEEVGASVVPPPPSQIEPRAEALIAATGADFRIGGARAYYNVTGDFVQVPPPAAYFEPINWHRTAFHELGHWAGHSSRLNRDHSGSFGSKSYAREELVAEMAGAFVCASLGIVPTVRHADYVGSWLEVLREDCRAVVRAASAASKAADFLLAFLPPAIDSVVDDNEEAA